MNIVGITYRKKNGKLKEDGTFTYKKGDPNYNIIKDYAVNGAAHYGKLILDDGTYDEVIKFRKY